MRIPIRSMTGRVWPLTARLSQCPLRSESDRILCSRRMPLCAKSGLMHCSKQRSLFDHPVGACEDGRWDVNANSFRRLEIDDEFELRRLFDWQFSRFGALQNSIHVFRGATKLIIPV